MDADAVRLARQIERECDEAWREEWKAMSNSDPFIEGDPDYLARSHEDREKSLLGFVEWKLGILGRSDPERAAEKGRRWLESAWKRQMRLRAALETIAINECGSDAADMARKTLKAEYGH